MGNATDEPLVNAQLLFRGSKLFRDGAISEAAYPARFAPFPGMLNVPVVGLAASGSASLFGVAAAQSLGNQLSIGNDADFVVQYAACDPFTVLVDGGPVSAGSGTFTNVYVQMRDESGKTYSNVPIHVNDLMGQGIPSPSGAGAQDDSILFFPGLFTPEIYIPRRHVLYFDVYRFDDPSAGPVDLQFRFAGTKVFPR